MSLSPYTVVVFSQDTGNVVPFAGVEIRERNNDGSSGNLAAIYSDSDGVSPITQPGVTTNSRGTIQFYANGDGYNVEYTVDGSTIIQPIDVGATVDYLNQRLAELVVSIDQFGAVPDGITDNTQAVQNCLNQARGKIVTCSPIGHYRFEGEVTMPENCVLEGAGAIWEFKAKNNGQCLITGSYNIIRDISIWNTGTESGGDGLYQVPINISDIRAATGQGTHHVIVENVTVYQQNVNSACIGVWADSHDIVLRNINIRNTTGTPLGILVHWGVQDDNLANGTNHGYNILIENIKCEQMKEPVKPNEGGIVFLSGCYNTTVRNVEVKDSYWSVRVQPGSVGNGNCLTYQKDLILTGITVENVNSYNVDQPLSVTWSAGAATFSHVPNIKFINCNSIKDTLDTTSGLPAYVLSAISGVTIEGGYSKNYDYGIIGSTFGDVGGVERLTVKDLSFERLGHSGIVIDNTSSDFSQDVSIENVRIFEVNKAQDTTPARAISAIYTEAERTKIRNVLIGRSSSEFAEYGVYFESKARNGSVDELDVIGVKPTGIAVYSQNVTNVVKRIINRSTAVTTSGTGRPSKCAFYATLGGTNQSIPDNSTTKLNFSNDLINEDDCFDTTLYRHKPKIAGYYTYTLCHILRGVSSQTIVRGEVWKNGTSYNSTEYNTHDPSTSSNVGGSGSVTIYMNGDTDYVEAYLYHNNGTAKDADGANKFGCHFSGHLI